MGNLKVSVLATLISFHAAIVAGYPNTTNGQLHGSYDFIIVGGGASGLTVANRLSENPSTTVLVIEAGDFDANEDYFRIPGLAGGAVGTKYDWNTSYIASESVNWRNISIPQGRVVGGSTKLNRMVFDRGSKSDYDRWEKLGNPGWNWEALLPYFKKNENFTLPSGEILEEYNITYEASSHGFSGYMHSSYAPFFWPTTKNIINAVEELEIGRSIDQANGDAIGGYFCPHNQNPETLERSSAREAYYETAIARKNLHIVTGHQVTRLVSKKNGDRVRISGVEFAQNKNSPIETIQVKKEVILAAGSLHTPQILQVSGIGDPVHLADINVTTVVELPGVGQNLQDHVMLTVVNTVNAPLVSSNLSTNATFSAEARVQYDTEKKGPLTSPTGDFLIFLPLANYSDTSQAIYNEAVAQNGTFFLPQNTPFEVVKGYKKQQAVLNNKLLSAKSGILEIIWADGAMVLGLQHPYSRGSVRAASSSVFDPPVADSGLLRNPLDVSILAEGVKFARKLTGTSSIQALKPFEILPGANVTSKDALEQFVRSSAATLFHPAGSTKIGSPEDGGVVDCKLKVHGVDGLRVVDASVIPLLPATHTMTTVYAIAEKAADLIKRG